MQKSTSAVDEDGHGSVTLDSDETWNEFFTFQNDPSRNITNPKPFARGENKYNGKDIKGKIAEQIKEEISKNMENNTIKYMRLKEAKREGNIVYPSVRVVLNDNEKKVNVTRLLSGIVCKKYNVKTITFCHPNPNKTRGACCYINPLGERVYEVINGVYEITFLWYVEGKESKITIRIKDEGDIRLIESNGVTEDELRSHREVKVGRKREPKYLHEAIVSQVQQEKVQARQTSHQLSENTMKAQEYLVPVVQIE